MKWNQFRLKTTTEAEDIVSSMLADLGIEGVQIEDKIPLTQSDNCFCVVISWFFECFCSL